MQIADYCREIETYLCRKNDGHLIRVVGPSFDLVTQWAADGIPLNVAFRGIDRYFERYYSKGPRRRPVRIDFCEADVHEVFDEWRRALGLPWTARLAMATEADGEPAPPSDDDDAALERRRSPSLPAHLERAVMRLTQARARGALGDAFDGLIDDVARELDAARASARGLRGDARTALIDRLVELDQELLQAAREALDEETRAALAREADEELAAFRDRMEAKAFHRAREAAIDRLVRESFGLPTIAFGP